MFNFLKNLFKGPNAPSDLMERATNSAMWNEAGSPSAFFTELSPTKLYSKEDYKQMSYQKYIDKKYNLGSNYDDFDDEILQQMQDQQMRDMQDQQLRDMHDPYINPGQDLIVDETYHGIDHGMDMGGHDHNY